ncbi:MAG: hypothetical protein Q8R12_04490 [bacterium]|nr:hypothetical protein [bacterium]
MIFILYGERFWARKKLNGFLAKAREKGGPIFRVDADSQTPLRDYLSRDLFGKKVCLVLEDLLQNPDREKEIKELLGFMASSEGNIVFLLEDELSEKWRESLKKNGAKLEKFSNPPAVRLAAWVREEAEKRGVALSPTETGVLVETGSEDPWTILNKLERRSLENIELGSKKVFQEPNYFDFADAASAKNKPRALLLLRSYMQSGFGAEEAFWKLWWKVKTLRLADSGASDTGLHPFVLKKAREDLGKYTSEELKNLSLELLELFSEVRRGETSFEEGLEKILLKL